MVVKNVIMLQDNFSNIRILVKIVFVFISILLDLLHIILYNLMESILF